MKICSTCGMVYHRKDCEYCRRAKSWEPATILSIFTPRIQQDLQELDLKNIKKEEISKVYEGTSVLLQGSTGTGKTIYAANLMTKVHHLSYIHRFEKIRTFDFLSTPWMLEQFRRSYEDPGLRGKVERWKTTDLLILDDIGVEKTSDWVRETLYNFINYRYEYQKRTIYTTNLSAEELSNSLDSRIPSRITQMCEIKKYFGETDKRIK